MIYFKRVAHDSKETDNPVALFSTKTRPAHRELHALLFLVEIYVPDVTLRVNKPTDCRVDNTAKSLLLWANISTRTTSLFQGQSCSYPEKD